MFLPWYRRNSRILRIMLAMSNKYVVIMLVCQSLPPPTVCRTLLLSCIVLHIRKKTSREHAEATHLAPASCFYILCMLSDRPSLHFDKGFSTSERHSWKAIPVRGHVSRNMLQWSGCPQCDRRNDWLQGSVRRYLLRDRSTRLNEAARWAFVPLFPGGLFNPHWHYFLCKHMKACLDFLTRGGAFRAMSECIVYPSCVLWRQYLPAFWLQFTDNAAIKLQSWSFLQNLTSWASASPRSQAWL